LGVARRRAAGVRAPVCAVVAGCRLSADVAI